MPDERWPFGPEIVDGNRNIVVPELFGNVLDQLQVMDDLGYR